MSTLVGNVAGTMLRVDNNSEEAGATALDLRVEPGKAPMKVNSATKVALLNADKVDGKDATAFYAAGSKVADSSHADQADNATNAQNASNADTVDGKHASDFAAAYERTVVVSPTGTDTENGTALLNALNGIPDASATKKYLIYIEPGTYDLGSGTLQMKEHVDIQGAGELNTLITSSVSRVFGCDAGTVKGANSAELRFLTVRNTGTTTSCHTAIWNNNASTRLTHVTAEAVGVGASDNRGVFNASNSNPTITDVTATASGGTFSYGVFNSGSSPTITDVTATASGGSSANYGVWDQTGSSPTIKQSKLSGTTNSLFHNPAFGGGTAKVALSQLVGPVGGSSFQCFNNYNENLAPVTCP
jgi:hypothetical protein